MERKIDIDALVLIGKDALIIPALAMVGAASIAGAIGYGAFKLGQKVADKISEMISVENETES